MHRSRNAQNAHPNAHPHPNANASANDAHANANDAHAHAHPNANANAHANANAQKDTDTVSDVLVLVGGVNGGVEGPAGMYHHLHDLARDPDSALAGWYVCL